MQEKYWGSQEATTDSGDSSSNDYNIVETEKNRIYFYSEIYRDKILHLNKEIKQMDNNHISWKEQRELENLDPIYLHIHSYGGSIFAGSSGMDNILQTKSKVITIVDGVAGSAATFLSIAGNERYITPNSYMLIHQLSSVMWGKYGEFVDEMKNLDKFMKKIKALYSKYTKIEEETLDKILKHDLYFSAEECVEKGLVDGIIGE